MGKPVDSQFIRYAISPFLALVTSPILANGLGPNGRGLYSSITNLLLMLAILFGYGFDLLLSTNTKERFAFSVLVSILKRYFVQLVVIAYFLSFIVLTILYNRNLNLLEIAIIGSLVPTLTIFNLVGSWARNNRNLHILGSMQSYSAVFRLLSIVLLYGFGFLTVANAVFFTLFANVPLLILIFKRFFPTNFRKNDSIVIYAGPRMENALKALPVGILTVATYRLDQILGIFIVGSGQLGIYAVAVSIAEIPILLIRSYKDGLYGVAQDRMSSLIRIAMTKVTILVASIALTIPFIFSLFFGAKFSSGLLITELMLIVILVQGLFELNSMYLLRIQKFDQIMVANTIYLLITFFVAILLRSQGAISLVIGNFVGYGLALLIVLVFRTRNERVNYGR